MSLADVLFLANEQHSPLKVAIFKQDLLNNILKNQTQALLDKIPRDAPDFNNDDFITLVNVVTSLDDKTITPKTAKLSMLNFAAGLDPHKAKVIEGIADMLVKLPMIPIADQNSLGEVDLQTRYFDPLLLPMISGTSKKAVLRWTNKEDTLTPDIHPDAIVSTLVQRVFGGDQVTNHLLCLDTLKLAVLSRNTTLKYNLPVGKSRMEPLGIIVFAVVITTSPCFHLRQLAAK